MVGVRRPAVAGTFYPATAPELRRAIDGAFAGSVPLPEHARLPKAIVVPHAGYHYSGAVAASAYRWVAGLRSTVERVVLLGPSHRVWIAGLAVPSATAFATPLGNVPVDAAGCATALRLPGVTVDDRAHVQEHSLEVELPFLQVVLGEFSVVPLSVGDATAADVADVIDALWGGPETLIVVSTDLSHYHRYDVAVARDSGTASVVVAMQPEAIGDEDACGARPLRGLLLAASRHQLGTILLDLRNSGDTGGDRDRVVGYGAFAVA